MFKVPDITVLPGGRKVRTDTRPYADEPEPEPVKKKSAPKPKAEKPEAEEDE